MLILYVPHNREAEYKVFICVKVIRSHAVETPQHTICLHTKGNNMFTEYRHLVGLGIF